MGYIEIGAVLWIALFGVIIAFARIARNSDNRIRQIEQKKKAREISA